MFFILISKHWTGWQNPLKYTSFAYPITSNNLQTSQSLSIYIFFLPKQPFFPSLYCFKLFDTTDKCYTQWETISTLDERLTTKVQLQRFMNTPAGFIHWTEFVYDWMDIWFVYQSAIRNWLRYIKQQFNQIFIYK